jgi:hypothetical protein
MTHTDSYYEISVNITRGAQKKPESFSGGRARCSTCFRC